MLTGETKDPTPTPTTGAPSTECAGTQGLRVLGVARPAPKVGTQSTERSGTRGPPGPPAPGAHTQARVEAAGVGGLLPQVLAVPVQLPGVSEVLHQRLHQAGGRQEVVALVAVVIPAQAARSPRVDGGQLRETDHLGAAAKAATASLP